MVDISIEETRFVRRTSTISMKGRSGRNSQDESDNISLFFLSHSPTPNGAHSRLFLLGLGLFFQLPLDSTLVRGSSMDPLEPCYKTRTDSQTGHSGRVIDDRLDGEEEHVLFERIV